MRAGLWRHGVPPAVGVLLGVAVGILANIVSGGGRTPAVLGLVAVAVVWAGWEGWHAVRAHRPPGGIAVRVGARVVRGGSVTGVRGPLGVGTADVSLAIGSATDAAITGIDATTPDESA